MLYDVEERKKTLIRGKIDKMTIKVTPTISDEAYSYLEEWADEQGRGMANLCAYILELVTNHSKNGQEIPGLPPPLRNENPEKLSVDFIKLLKSKSSKIELTHGQFLILAKKYNVSIEKLMSLINERPLANGNSKES